MRFSKLTAAAAVTAAAVTAAASIIAFAVPAAASAARNPARATDYDLSLGDSLSIGVQPDASGTAEPTDQGYANDLYARLKHVEARHGRNLKLVELGCSGETSTTMIDGGICTYPDAASQLAAAEQFLSAHRGHVALVTVSIGANDVDKCATLTSVNVACVEQGLATLKTNLATITAGLRSADAGSATTFAGINLYDPFLAAWLTGSQGETLATESVSLVGDLNAILENGYSQADYKVADVAGVFKTTQFSPEVPLPGAGQVPLNVARICRFTWMCAAAPVGPNVHPNAAGYAIIARALSSAIGISRH
jgi:lysophospholipase L1-like esterase